MDDGDDDAGEQEWRAAKLFLAKGPSAALQFATDDLKSQLYALDAQAMDGPAPAQEEGSSAFLDPALSRRLQAWRNLGDMTKAEAKKRFLLLLTSILPHWKTWKPPAAASPSLSPSPNDGLAARILADFSAKTGVSFRSGL
jgi:acyl-CoA-binding protein